MQRKVAIYCRTSTGRQETGLESQLRACRDWCQRNSVDDKVEFLDEGVSGTKDSRPELDRMLKRVRAREFQVVVIYSFSRLSRSLRHMILLADELKDLKVDLVSITDSIDTTSAMGRAMFSIIGVFSQLERDLTAERVKNGLKNARAKGKRLGRPARAMKHADAVVVLASQGKRPEAIAKELGISRTSVYDILRSRAKLT